MKSRNKRSLSDLIGKRVLIGLTYVNSDGSEHHRAQLHGVITAADPDTVVTIRLSGDGGDFTLPPHLEAFEPASPGEYRLAGTGEVVSDPDLLTTWTINAAEDSVSDGPNDAGFVPPSA